MRIEAHLDDRRPDRIVVAFFGTQRDVAESMRKAVSASKYLGGTDHDNRGIRFGYPLSVDKCNEMREAWGTDLKVHRKLSEWYVGAKGERQQQVSLTTQTDAELRIVPERYPDLNAYLFGDQRVTAAWIANAYRGGGLLADEVGTGKTVGVIAGLVEGNVTGDILIVCPKISVRSVWGRELARHLPDAAVFLCRGNRKRRQATIDAFFADETSERRVLVVVSEMLRLKAVRGGGRIVKHLGYEYPDLFEVDWDAVVVDESQRMLGSADVVRGNLAGEGLKSLSYAEKPLKLAVSATPFGKGGTIDALFGTLHWLWPDEFTSRWAWLGKYFEISDERVFVKGGRGATKLVKRIGGIDRENEARLWEELGPRVLRRTMEEVSPAHRGMKNYVEVLCEMDTTQRVQYTKFAEDGELAVDGGVVSSMGTLDYMTRSRQFANGVLRKEGGRVVYTGESCKIDKLLAHLERLEVGRKVVIASQWNEYLDVVEDRLNRAGYWSEYVGHAGTHKAGALLRIDGSTSEGRRDAYMHLFQTDPRHTVFLLNSQAGGVSITLDAADEMHALDEMFPPEANTQLFGRIFRRGRVHQVLYYLYRSMGTIDEQIGYKVGEGHTEQLRILDGRRGREYVRTLARYKEDDEPVGVPFLGGRDGKIRKCRGCGVSRNQYHLGDCTWSGE